MGGKNEAPEAPDYGPLAAASEKSAAYAYDLAKQQQAWAEKVYADNKGVSDIVIDKALGQLDQQTADAQRARERYQSLFEPLEEQLAKDAQDYSTPERQEQEAGKAEADVASQFATARQTAQDRLEAYGVDPSSTRAGALDLGTRIAEAAAQSSAGNQARTQVENTGRALRSEAINVGRGYPGQIANSSAAAGQAGNQAVNTGLAQTASGAQTMGTGLGWQSMGNNAIGTWGNVLNQGFSNELDAWKANEASSSGWGSALGLVGGLASKAFALAEGGAIPAPGGGPVPVEASPSNGAVTDDVPATIEGAIPAKLNAGEFVFPKDVMAWRGEQWAQKEVMKARKEMTGGEGERPAQPDVQEQPMPVNSPGAIPMRGA